jgi:hypothetical protein
MVNKKEGNKMNRMNADEIYIYLIDLLKRSGIKHTIEVERDLQHYPGGTIDTGIYTVTIILDSTDDQWAQDNLAPSGFHRTEHHNGKNTYWYRNDAKRH